MNCKKLLERLTAPIESFSKLGDTIDTVHGPLTHIDRGGNILAVAHLDFVLWNDKPKITHQYQNVLIEDCPQLDDRLGAWMCLDVLPRANMVCDVLLTDSEELGESTAQYFESPKEYNWIIQFDRAGSDVVMYEYEDKEYSDMLRSYDYRVSSGAYSDICKLQSLKCKAFNFGVGYHNQHSDSCYANLSETFDSFRKVQAIYSDWKDYHFEHKEVVRQQESFYAWGGSKCSKYTGPMGFQSYKDEKIELEDELTLEEEREDEIELEAISQRMFAKSFFWLDDEERKIVEQEQDDLYAINHGDPEYKTIDHQINYPIR